MFVELDGEGQMNLDGAEKTCHSCVKSYMGADSRLRCRINALSVSRALWEDCKQYEREPGSDDEIRDWNCCGRGD